MAQSAFRASAPALLTNPPTVTPPSTTPDNSRSHRRNNTREIDNTISHPGSVKINVEGAFICDRDNASPDRSPNHETTDIRLPNHTDVVSHIAVDVCVTSINRGCRAPS